MSAPVPSLHQAGQSVAEFIERHETLRMIMEWITDRFADAPEVDTSIAWEDGEERDEDQGSSPL